MLVVLSVEDATAQREALLPQERLLVHVRMLQGLFKSAEREFNRKKRIQFC